MIHPSGTEISYPLVAWPPLGSVCSLQCAVCSVQCALFPTDILSSCLQIQYLQTAPGVKVEDLGLKLPTVCTRARDGRVLHVGAACGSCMWVLHMAAACGCYMCVLPVGAACACCMYGLLVGAACGTCMWVLHVAAACGSCMCYSVTVNAFVTLPGLAISCMCYSSRSIKDLINLLSLAI